MTGRSSHHNSNHSIGTEISFDVKKFNYNNNPYIDHIDNNKSDSYSNLNQNNNFNLISHAFNLNQNTSTISNTNNNNNNNNTPNFIFDPIRNSSPSILMNNSFNFKNIPPPPQSPIHVGVNNTSPNNNNNNNKQQNKNLHTNLDIEEDDLLSNDNSSLSSLSSSPILNSPSHILISSNDIINQSLVNSTSSTELLKNHNLQQQQQQIYQDQIYIDIYDQNLTEAAADNIVNIFNSKWLSSLAYLTWLGAVFVLIKEKRSVFIQFHSLQSYIVGVSVIGIQFLFAWSIKMTIIIWCSYLVFILFMIYQVLIHANRQIPYKLPIIGNYCENFAIKRSLDYSLLLKRLERQQLRDINKREQEQQQQIVKNQNISPISSSPIIINNQPKSNS